MKIIAIAAITSLLYTTGFAQTQYPRGDTVGAPHGPEVFSYVEQMPQASVDISKYMSEHITYPEDARQKGLEGRVILKFVVDQDGIVGQINVIRGVCPSMDSEAVRVVSGMPKWKPAKQNGRSVSCYFTMPIVFQLHDKPTGLRAVAGVDIPPEASFDVAKYLQEHLVYPSDARAANIQGRVIVRFLVNEHGDVVDPQVTRPVYPSLDSAAKAVVTSMPRWRPATQQGKPVKCFFTLPILFKLDDNKKPEDPLATLDAPKAENDQINDQIFVSVEKMPAPAFDLKNYLAEHLKYPEDARAAGIEGRVHTTFVVRKDGRITNVRITRSLYPSLDNEALRVLREMPAWKPGSQNGKVVNVYFDLPISFKL